MKAVIIRGHALVPLRDEEQHKDGYPITTFMASDPQSCKRAVTVKELKDFLAECPDDAEVTAQNFAVVGFVLMEKRVELFRSPC